MYDFHRTSKIELVLSRLCQLMGLFLAAAALNLVFMPHGKAATAATPAARAAMMTIDHRAIAAGAVSVDDVATVEMSIAAYER